MNNLLTSGLKLAICFERVVIIFGVEMAKNKKQRTDVYNKLGGRCAYCGEEITYKQMQVDHIVPQYNFINAIKNKNNDHNTIYGVPEFLFHLQLEDCDHIDNLMPACRVCNKWKDTFSIEQFRIEISKQVERARKYSRNFRMAEKYGLIAERPSKVTFYFENANEKQL